MQFLLFFMFVMLTSKKSFKKILIFLNTTFVWLRYLLFNPYEDEKSQSGITSWSSCCRSGS